VDGFKRLDQLVRTVEEGFAPKADFELTVEHERAISSSLDGRTVMDDRKARKTALKKDQLSLF
jgi:hypothetical protein